MLPINCGSHADYQNFVVTNLRKYYPFPDALAKSTWNIIERFWHLDLSQTDTLLAGKYSKFGPTPRTPSCMQRSYLSSRYRVTLQAQIISAAIVFPNLRGRETLTYFYFVFTTEFKYCIICVLSTKISELTASSNAVFSGFK